MKSGVIKVLKIKDLKEKYIKKNSNVLIFIVFGIILIIGGSQFIEKDKIELENDNTVEEVVAVNSDNEVTDYERQMEEKVEKILSQIEGAGNVAVMMTYESGEEIIPAFNSNNSETVTEEKDDRGGVRNIATKEDDDEIIVIKGGEGIEEPIILKKLKPKLVGIVVAAEGANNPKVKLNIQEAMKALFNLQSNRIVVLQKEK
jgi:stage III sporulation protein AG